MANGSYDIGLSSSIRLDRSNTPLKKPSNGSPDFTNSEPGKTIVKALSLVLKVLLMLVPKDVRAFLSKSLSILRAKLLIGRLGLASLSPKADQVFHFGSVDREVITIDGVSLKTTHLYPHRDDRKQHPCIILRTPYYRYFDYGIAIHFVHRGYHVLIQDVRGRFESTGNFTLNEYELSDSGCTLKWLGEQPWSDKTVGVVGLSMGGYTSWNCFANYLNDYNRHGVQVKAVVPVVSSCDILKVGTYPKMDKKNVDPVVSLGLMTKYTQLTYHLDHPKTIFGSYLLWVIFKFIHVSHGTKSLSWKEKERHLPLGNIDLVITGTVPTPRLQLIPDPTDKYYERLDLSWAVKRLGSGEMPSNHPRPYGCFVSGWFDIFGRSTVRDFQLACANQPEDEKVDDGNRIRLIMGDYHHFDDYVVVMLRSAIRTFDRAFFGDSYSYSKQSKVSVACIGAEGWIRRHRPLMEQLKAQVYPSTSHFSLSNEKHHSWRHFDRWPPKEAKNQLLTLSAGGMLLAVASTEDGNFDEASSIQSDSPTVSYPESISLPNKYECKADEKETSVSDDKYNRLCKNLVLDNDYAESFIWNPYDPTPTVGGVIFDFRYAGMQEQASLIKRDDTLVYTTAPLKSEIEIAGEVNLSLFVKSSARSFDVFAKLCLVPPPKHRTLSHLSFYPEGEETYNLCEGIERCTLDSSEDIMTSYPKKVNIDLGPICAAFIPGSRIRLIISGGSFPQYSRNLGYGEHVSTATKMTPAKHTIYWGDSRLTLPVTSTKTLEAALDPSGNVLVNEIISRDTELSFKE